MATRVWSVFMNWITACVTLHNIPIDLNDEWQSESEEKKTKFDVGVREDIRQVFGACKGASQQALASPI
ncbi:hypothetical protein GQ600_3962 [Phytophthora cactorum]|nr:hypothetical protein GQ600_3962 [Phytophthora cactorum]